MNPKEKEIIQHLRKGKRVNISAIARELDVPISTIADRIRKIEQKYIMKRSSLLDYAKIGYNSNQMLAIKVDREKKSLLLDFLKKQKHVNSIYSINSNFSFLIELVCRNHFEFITWLDEIKMKFPLEITSFQILKVEDKEMFVPE
ncbi:Lrp/AsnC family transcriptional regulator [candidate division KSB1 bacterium]